jgi:Cupin-like domain
LFGGGQPKWQCPDGWDGGGIMGPDSSVVRRHYNRRCFPFEHDIHENPLFDVDHLAELVCREPELCRSAYCSCAPVSVKDPWAQGVPSPETVRDAVHKVATNNSLIILRHIERSVSIGPVLREFMEQVVVAVGPALRNDIKISRATVLIASPRRITSYHLDSNTNFLYQIHGDKRLSVFDPGDRTLVTPEELEGYYGGNINAAQYKPERQADAQVFDLHAGSAVHIPSHAPHWAQNLDSVSVALSINFDLNSIERAGRIHRLNGRLRSLGFFPQAPGGSPWKDEIKLGMSALNRGMHRWTHTTQASEEREYR